jgi:hypothetical protein
MYLHLTIDQVRIVSRIALLLARDGGSAPPCGDRADPAGKCRKTGRFGI